MVINSPYHSSMEKEIKKAAKIIDAFFDSTVDADKAIPLELIQNCAGLAFLTVVKAGFIWSGKLGTGVVISKLEDGSWSPPSGIGTAGIGFGAEIGGEIIDFMIVLGSQSAVQTFKRGTQISVGAGLELAIGPVGRAAAANLNAGGSGISSNYTYSHAKGLFAGVGLHGSTIMVRGDMNNQFYGQEVSPMQILNGSVAPPPGSCDILQDAIRRAQYGGDSMGRSSYDEPMRVVPPADRATISGSGNLYDYKNRSSSSNLRHSFTNSPSGIPSSQTYNFKRSESDVTKDNDPRLKRYSGYKSEKDLYAQYSKNQHTSPAAQSCSTPSYYTPAASASAAHYASAPARSTTSNQRNIPIPPPAEAAETKQVFNEVISFMKLKVPYANLQVFKDNCRLFGQDQMSVDVYFSYLNSICTSNLLKELVPKLVRLLPTHEKRAAIWELYLKVI